MDELQQKEEYLFEENEENIVIKYKLLRSLIIKHYHRGCKYLEITKIVCAIFFLIFTAVGLIVCSNGGSKAFWLIMWIIIIFVLVNIFLITDYCKYLVKSKVIPYLEDDNQIEFGEYSIFAEDKNEDEDDEDDEDDEVELDIVGFMLLDDAGVLLHPARIVVVKKVAAKILKNFLFIIFLLVLI